MKQPPFLSNLFFVVISLIHLLIAACFLTRANNNLNTKQISRALVEVSLIINVCLQLDHALLLLRHSNCVSKHLHKNSFSLSHQSNLLLLLGHTCSLNISPHMVVVVVSSMMGSFLTSVYEEAIMYFHSMFVCVFFLFFYLHFD